MDTSRPSGGAAGSKSRTDFSKSSKSSQPGTSGTSASLQPSLNEISGQAGSVRSQTSQVTDVAASLGADMKEAANSARRAVQEQASEFAADIGHELRQTAEGQKMRGVEAIQGFARAIGSGAAELEDQSPRIAQSVRDAARKVEGLANNISNRSVDDLLKAATDLARAQPMLFIGGAVAAGFALSRFLKSSSDGLREEARGEDRHAGSMAGQSYRRSGSEMSGVSQQTGRSGTAMSGPSSPSSGQRSTVPSGR